MKKYFNLYRIYLLNETNILFGSLLTMLAVVVIIACAKGHFLSFFI